MLTELTEIGRKMHKEWGNNCPAKEILLSDRWKKNKNFAANRKIWAILNFKKKSGVESGFLKPSLNSDNKKTQGSLNLGNVFKLVEQDDDFPSVSTISKINSEKDMALDLTIGDDFRGERTHTEKTANCLPVVNISTVPRMGPKKSENNERVKTNIHPVTASDIYTLGVCEPNSGNSGNSLIGSGNSQVGRRGRIIIGYDNPKQDDLQRVINASCRSSTESVWALTESDSVALQIHKRSFQGSLPRTMRSRTLGVRNKLYTLNANALIAEDSLMTKVESLSDKVSELTAIMKILAMPSPNLATKAAEVSNHDLCDLPAQTPGVQPRKLSQGLTPAKDGTVGKEHTEKLELDFPRETSRSRLACLLLKASGSEVCRARSPSKGTQGTIAKAQHPSGTLLDNNIEAVLDEPSLGNEPSDSSRAIKEDDGSDSWICGACTLLNHMDLSLCLACASSRVRPRGNTSRGNTEQEFTLSPRKFKRYHKKSPPRRGTPSESGSRYECLNMETAPEETSDTEGHIHPADPLCPQRGPPDLTVGGLWSTPSPIVSPASRKGGESYSIGTGNPSKEKKVRSIRCTKQWVRSLEKSGGNPEQLKKSEHQLDPSLSTKLTDTSPHIQTGHAPIIKKRIDYKEEIVRAVLDRDHPNELGTYKFPKGGSETDIPADKVERSSQTEGKTELHDSMIGRFGVSDGEGPATSPSSINYPKRLNSIIAARRLAGIPEDVSEPLSVSHGLLTGPSKLFTYHPKTDLISRKRLLPLLTPGSGLNPDLLEETREGWNIISGLLTSDLGLHWLRIMVTKSQVIPMDALPSLTMTVMASTRNFFNNKVNSIRERLSGLASVMGASFILTGSDRPKWIRTGSSEGIRLVYDTKKSTLKVWRRLSTITSIISDCCNGTNSAAAPSSLEGADPEANLVIPLGVLSTDGYCNGATSSESPSSFEGANLKANLVTPLADLDTVSGASMDEIEVPIDSLGRVRTQEDLDKVLEFTNCPVIRQRTVAPVCRPRLFRDSVGIKELEAE